MPTMSPALTDAKSRGSSVSSAMLGVPYLAGVAPASTNSQRGVITPTPNERWLGLTRWTITEYPVPGYGRLREQIESAGGMTIWTSRSCSCAVALRLPLTRRLKRRHGWRGTSLGRRAVYRTLLTAFSHRADMIRCRFLLF